MNSSVVSIHYQLHKTAAKSQQLVKINLEHYNQQVSCTFPFTESSRGSSSHSLSNIERQIDELDLISFNIDENSQQAKNVGSNEEDPYNKLKESILKLNENRSQIVPYNNANQQATPQSFTQIYSTPSANSYNPYYSQQMYFNPSYYPRIGFERFIPQQQPYTNYSTYNYSHVTHHQQQQAYGFYSQNQLSWNRTQVQSSPLATLPSSNQLGQQSIPTTTTSVVRMETPQIMAPESIKSFQSSSSSKSSVAASSSTYSQRNASTPQENLINLDEGDDSNFFSNILQAFDPLTSKNEEASKSYYTDQDPFDYIYSGGTQYSDPLYEAVVRGERSVTSPKNRNRIDEISSEYYGTVESIKKQIESDQDEPPPLPPRNSSVSNSSINSQQFYTNNVYSKKLYENILERRKFDRDSLAFYKMVKDLRSKYEYSDEISNIGHVVASMLDSKYFNVSSIKILVYPSFECFNLPNDHQKNYKIKSSSENYQKLDKYLDPVTFTCDINSSISHVIMQVLTVLENELSGSVENYVLKTIGSQEWLSANSTLGQLEYIHNSIKLEKDVQLGLFPKKDEYLKVIARSSQDDERDAQLKIENILPKEPNTSISYETLIILLETLEMEIDKLEAFCETPNHSSLNASGVIQAVKAICALLGSIDTFELYKAINELKSTCDEQMRNILVSLFKVNLIITFTIVILFQQPPFKRGATIKIVDKNNHYSDVSLQPRSFSGEIKSLCDEIRDSVQHLLEVYSQAFHVNFSVNRPTWQSRKY